MALSKNAQIILKKLEVGESLTSQETKIFEKLKHVFGILDNGTIKTISALAEILGVSRVTVYKWKAEGMPIEEGGGYDPEKILKWRGSKSRSKEDEPEDSEGEVSEKVRWEVCFRKFRAKLAETAYKKEIGELISRREAEALLVDRAVEFKKVLLGRGRRLSLRLAHKNAQECQRILDEDSLSILKAYSRENTLTGKINAKDRVKHGEKKAA